MKRIYLLLLLLASYKVQAQQFSQYNTRTLFDSFENPSQKAFKADTSRKYAFNFFIPTTGISASASGPAEKSFRILANQQVLDASTLTYDGKERNTILLNSNTYLAMFRIFKTVALNREMGFSWQLRSSTYAKIRNETITLFDDFRILESKNYPDALNNKIYSVNYHQFSFTYREDFDKRLGLGVKLSYLSGILYNNLDITSSSLTVDKPNDAYSISFNEHYRSNVYYKDLNSDIAKPGFKNPGLAFTASANYKLKGGWYLLGNLKDIGFIHWNKNSATFNVKTTIDIDKASESSAADRLQSNLDSVFRGNIKSEAFTSMIDGKAQILINKDFGFYQPNFLLSKNIAFPGADIALMNNFRAGNWNFDISTAYNTAKIFQVGGQIMFKSTGFEMFGGSDQLFKTYQIGKGSSKSTVVGSGYSGASFYFGFGLKFGPIMEHQANASRIPGFGGRRDNEGFFKRIFSRKR